MERGRALIAEYQSQSEELLQRLHLGKDTADLDEDALEDLKALGYIN